MKIFIKSYRIVMFLLYYIFKMLQANLSIAFDILSPKMNTSPGFIVVLLRVSSKRDILLFTNLLSMTPGTLSVDINSDQNTLLVHCLYNEDREAVVNEIEQMQDKILKLTV